MRLHSFQLRTYAFAQGLAFCFFLIPLTELHGQSAPQAAWTITGTNVSFLDHATDQRGNIYTTGFYRGSTTIGVTALAAPDNAMGASYFFVSKLNSAGVVQWVSTEQTHILNQTNDSLECAGSALALDSAGNVYVLGYLTSTEILINGLTLRNSRADGTADMFLMKYTPDGSFLWVKQFQGDGDDRPVTLATSHNQLYAGGYYASTKLLIGSDTLKNSAVDGSNDMWLAAFDYDGNVKWTRSYGGANGEDEVNALAVDVSGNLHLTADAGSSTCIIEGHPIKNTGGDVIFTALFSPAGALQWIATANDGSFGQSTGIGVDHAGNTIVLGEFQGRAIKFGNSVVTNTDQTTLPQNLVVIRYDQNGNPVSAMGGGTSAPDSVGVYPIDCKVDSAGSVYIIGGFPSAALKISNHSVVNPTLSGTALFAIKLGVDNSFDWSFVGSGVGENVCTSIDMNRDSSVNITAVFTGSGFALDGVSIANQGIGTGFVSHLQFKRAGVAMNSEPDIAAALFPNPFSTMAELDIAKSSLKGRLVIRIYDVLGRVVRSYEQSDQKSLVFERAGLSSGAYRIVLADEHGQLVTLSAVIE